MKKKDRDACMECLAEDHIKQIHYKNYDLWECIDELEYAVHTMDECKEKHKGLLKLGEAIGNLKKVVGNHDVEDGLAYAARKGMLHDYINENANSFQIEDAPIHGATFREVK